MTWVYDVPRNIRGIRIRRYIVSDLGIEVEVEAEIEGYICEWTCTTTIRVDTVEVDEDKLRKAVSATRRCMRKCSVKKLEGLRVRFT